MASQPEMRDRETRGQDTSSQHFVVPEEEIAKLIERPPLEYPAGVPDVIFSAIDPSGGGSGSDFVVVSIAIINGNQTSVSFYSRAAAPTGDRWRTCPSAGA
jgi:hypothetical protein